MNAEETRIAIQIGVKFIDKYLNLLDIGAKYSIEYAPHTGDMYIRLNITCFKRTYSALLTPKDMLDECHLVNCIQHNLRNLLQARNVEAYKLYRELEANTKKELKH